MPRNNMPEDWQPPAPAWQADWKNSSEPIVVGYFGIQADVPDNLENWANKAFYGDFKPKKVDKASFVDKNKVKNFIYACYWLQSDYQRWWEVSKYNEWWADDKRLNERVGYWREIITMPHERLETLNSSMQPHGVSEIADNLTGPIEEHGYPGGMRDRIELSDSKSLRNQHDTFSKIPAIRTCNGKRVLVTPPENTCVIRSGQNWTDCDKEQGSFYLSKVHPVLIKGMEYLRDNPEQTYCYSMRFADTKTDDWKDTCQSFGLGYAKDVYAFEEWAKSHATHLAILDRFMEMVVGFGEDLQLKLWHEVVVLPNSGCEFEYLSCHQETGLLNYT